MPCIWFDHEAEEAVKFYVSLFNNGKIGKIARYGKASAKESGQPEGSVLTVEFELDGNKFLALNGGSHFKLTGAISFIIDCATQEEIDHFWDAFADGGQTMQCGWITDKFGVTWQVVPAALNKMLTDKDPAKAKRAMEAMLEMIKLDINALKKAYDGVA